MATGRRFGAVIFAAMMAGACASASRHTLADRFVRQGSPTVGLGGSRTVATRPIDRQALLRAMRAAPPPSATAAGSLEASDPQLRAALARLAAAATTSRFLDVADEYIRLGIRDHALDYLNRSVAINGGDADAYDAIARVWRNWGQPDVALGSAHRAVFLAPQSPVVHNTLGTVLFRLGRVSDAKACFARAFALDPNAWYALANLCHLSMQAGDTRAAIDQCRRAEAIRKRGPRE